MVKHLPTMRETWVQSLGWEDPLEKEMATHSSTLARKSHGRRSVVAYSPWSCKESDMTERLHFLLSGWRQCFCQINKSLLVAQCEASNCLMVYSFIKIRKGCPSCPW